MKWASLKAGDLIELVAPGSALVDESYLDKILAFIDDLGLKSRIALNEKKGDQLKDALYAEDSQAVWCIRGGYGSIKWLPSLAVLQPPQKSKLVIGFSDITILHLFLNQKWGWETIHGEMLNRWCAPEFRYKFELLKNIIFGINSQATYTDLKPLNALAKMRPQIEGILMIGNLAVFQSSLATPWQMVSNDKILVIEEVHECAYRIDRMLEQLKQANILNSTKAIIFGDMDVGLDANESALINKVLMQFATVLLVPVYQIKGIGHGEYNHPLPFGGRGMIDSDFNLICFF